MGRATLAPRAGMVAEVPPLRPRPLATMKDMGMGDMGAMAGDDASCPPDHAAMGHCTPAGGGAMAGMDHGSGGGIGRASSRVRVCQYVEISVVAVSVKKKQ